MRGKNGHPMARFGRELLGMLLEIGLVAFMMAVAFALAAAAARGRI